MAMKLRSRNERATLQAKRTVPSCRRRLEGLSFEPADKPANQPSVKPRLPLSGPPIQRRSRQSNGNE